MILRWENFFSQFNYESSNKEKHEEKNLAQRILVKNAIEEDWNENKVRVAKFDS